MKKQARCDQDCDNCKLANKEKQQCFQAGEVYEAIENLRKEIFLGYQTTALDFTNIEHASSVSAKEADEAITWVIDGRFGDLS